MSAQNWTPGFNREFRRHRGHDPTPYPPAMIGHAVSTPDLAERFFWDWRMTTQELVFTHLALVNGLWTIRFQPGRGVPAEPRCGVLFDWSRHTNSGVRHFPDPARYATQLDWPLAAGHPAGASRIVLNLGRMAAMADMRLHGRDPGLFWTAPWRVDVTDALQAGRNPREIAVANLWPDCLIGDASLPPAPRVTWTTGNPFHPDSPLLESGLPGPVTLQTMRLAE